MKFFLVALAVIAVVSAQQQPPIAIVRQSADIAPDGTYEYSYETENGIHVSARGQPGPVNEEGAAAIVSQGDFGYVGDDGNNYAVRYTADENGYHPEGDHLPVAPPIPEAIARAIEYIRTHPQPPQSQEQ